MEFLRNFYNYDVTGGKLVSERVLEENWNVAVGASATGTLSCVDTWIEISAWTSLATPYRRSFCTATPIASCPQKLHPEDRRR